MPKTTSRQRSRKGAPGIVEVARRAGVSPATVSRYFNYPDRVRVETRTRIAEAASALGYIRDRMAGTLHNRFSGTIALIVPTVDNAIFAELIEAFSKSLQQRERNMLLASHNYDLNLEVSIIRSVLERRIDGVAIIGHHHQPAALEMLKVRAIPALALWNYRRDTKLPFIGADNADAGRQVTQHLLDLGHRDIAILFPETHTNDRARDRRQGVLNTLERAGVVVPPHRRIACEYNIRTAKETVTELLKGPRPTALVCGNDVIAQGAIYAALRAGLDLPGDLSIVGIGDFRGSAEFEPALTTVRLPARRIGKQAADMLVRASEQRMARVHRNNACRDEPPATLPDEAIGAIGVVGADGAVGPVGADELEIREDGAVSTNVRVAAQLIVRASTAALP